MFFMQRIMATFCHASLQTEYNALRVYNYTILRGCSPFSVKPKAKFSGSDIAPFVKDIANFQRSS